MAVIGLGLDLVDTEEAARLLDRWGERLLLRLLTDAERAYVTAAAIPAQHLAVRLAAKEAVYKAMQSLPDARAIRWRDIEVVRHDGGRPLVVLHAAAREIADRGGVHRIAVSLTHTSRSAGAVAILEGEPPAPVTD